jgi:hypothetical protein
MSLPPDTWSASEQHARAAEVEAARRAVNAAADARAASRPETIALWRQAVDRFWTALRGAYPPGFRDIWARLAQSDADAIETAVVFLEVDPWFFRSGYMKEELIRRLNRLELSGAVVSRLRHVVVAAVDRSDRREFRRYCRLARRVDSLELRQALRERCASPEAGVRRRAAWMLAAVENRAGQAEVRTAQIAWRRAHRSPQ